MFDSVIEKFFDGINLWSKLMAIAQSVLNCRQTQETYVHEFWQKQLHFSAFLACQEKLDFTKTKHFHMELTSESEKLSIVF